MLTSPTDHVVTTGAVPLAARDFGGTGRPLLLLHGLGGGLRDWDSFAPLLTGEHRVIAYDQRGHGASGPGPWDWDVALDDAEAIVAHFGLENPALVGHSLGGAIATKWGLRHPDCPGAVNIDMLRMAETALENYVGMDPEHARAECGRLTARFEEQAGGLPPMFTAIRTALLAEDMFALFGQARCPLLVCVATRDLPHQGDFAELMTAYRAGIARDIAAIEDTNPNVRFARLPGSHVMTTEVPEQLASVVRQFLQPSPT